MQCNPTVATPISSCSKRKFQPQIHELGDVVKNCHCYEICLDQCFILLSSTWLLSSIDAGYVTSRTAAGRRMELGAKEISFPCLFDTGDRIFGTGLGGRTAHSCLV